MEFNNLTAFQQHCISNGIPFVSYRLPGIDFPVTMLGKVSNVHLSGSVTNEVNRIPLIKQPPLPSLPSVPGFIISPFTSSSLAVWLQASKIIEGIRLKGIDFSDEDLGINDGADSPIREKYATEDHLPEGKLPMQVTKEAYIQQVNKILQAIKEGTVEKAVLSRTILIPFDAGKEAPQLFNQLTQTYKDAFVYLISFPEAGTWIGATPELLLSAWYDIADSTTLNDQPMHIRTMALAGTRKSGTTGEWGAKEIEEQQWVVTYIQEKLAASGCTGIMQSDTYTAAAGNVEHLRTDFRASIPASNINILLQQLHPTPAVCGWPTDKALELILETENYNRSYYTGFLGPVNVDGASGLYVNLRCMQATNKLAALYIGGGITRGSIPEDEWEETSIKSRTLLSEIEKIRNLAH
jgi:isochorismate synthase